MSGRAKWHVGCFCFDESTFTKSSVQRTVHPTEEVIKSWIHKSHQTMQQSKQPLDFLIVVLFTSDHTLATKAFSRDIFGHGFTRIDIKNTEQDDIALDASIAIYATPTTRGEIRESRISPGITGQGSARVDLRLYRKQVMIHILKCPDAAPVARALQDSHTDTQVCFVSCDETAIKLPVEHNDLAIQILGKSAQWETLAMHDGIGRTVSAYPGLTEPSVRHTPAIKTSYTGWHERILGRGISFVSAMDTKPAYIRAPSASSGVAAMAVIQALDDYEMTTTSDIEMEDTQETPEEMSTDVLMESVEKCLTDVPQPVQLQIIDQLQAEGSLSQTDADLLRKKREPEPEPKPVPQAATSKKSPESAEGSKSIFERIVTTLSTSKKVKMPEPTPVGVEIVAKCFEWIEQNGIDEEGIYRLAGSASKVAQLYQNLFGGVSLRPDIQTLLDKEEPRTVATVVKRYFRNLPESLLGGRGCSFEEWFEAGTAVSPQTQNAWLTETDGSQKLLACYKKLPRPNQFLVSLLMVHLAKIALRCSENKMKVDNLAVVFGPTVLRAPDAALLDQKLVVGGNKVVSSMIKMSEMLQDICPETPFTD